MQQYQAQKDLRDSSALMAKGNYRACFKKNEEIFERFPKMGDRALFQVGTVSLHPKNTKKDYERTLSYFQKLIKEYPESRLKDDAEALVSLINGVVESEKKAKSLQKQTENLEKQASDMGKQVEYLQKQIGILEEQIEQIKAVDLSIDKKKRKYLAQ